MSTQKDINLTAEYGRTKTYMTSIIGSCIVLSMLLIGGYITYSAFSTKNNKKKIFGEIIQIRPARRNVYSAIIRYFIDDKEYNSAMDISNYMSIGSRIELYYDINNPYNISNSGPSSVIISGSALISCAVLICCFLIYNVYTVSKYDQAAIQSAYSVPTHSYGYGYPPPFQPIIRL
jgi:hypothetical protein